MTARTITKDDLYLARYLDRSIVKEAKLNLISCFVWMWWGKRRYARNTEQWRDGFAMTVMYYVVITLSLLFFQFCPLRLLGLLGLSVATMVLLSTVMVANKSKWIGIFHLAIGGIGLLMPIHLGLTLFDDPIDRIVFGAFVVAGLLYLYRRIWNATIWRGLDRILWRYYKKHRIDFASHVNMVSDYRYAFEAMTQRLRYLLNIPGVQQALALDQEQVDCFESWLSNGTERGLERSLRLLDQEMHCAKTKS